jgi:hypothetical protein
MAKNKISETYPPSIGPKVQVLAQCRPWAGGLQFLLLVDPRFPGDKQFVATNITFEEYKEGTAFEPTFKVAPENAQALMDELWKAGCRPSNGEGSVGQLGATQKHLGDMRRLVEHLTEAKLP